MTRIKTKVELHRNKFGTVIGVVVNGVKLPYVREVNVKHDGGVTKLNFEMLVQDVNYVEVDTYSGEMKEEDDGPYVGPV